MNSSYGKSNNKTSPIDAFDFDLGLGSGRPTPLNGQKTQPPSYTQQRPSTAASWAHQPNKPAWTHQPAPSVPSSGPGSLAGPTSMVGDIFGKTWNSSVPSSSGVASIGIVNNKNPNLFSDLLGSTIGPNKSAMNAPLKNSAPVASPNTFKMGSMASALPKTDNLSNVNNVRSSSLGGGGGNFGGNSSASPNLGGPSLKNMSGSGLGSGGMSSNKDAFSSFDFLSKPSGGMNSASKPSAKSDSGANVFGSSQTTASKTSNVPSGDFGFSANFSENKSQPPKQSNDFDALFTPSEDFTEWQASEGGGDDFGMNSEFVGGNDNTVELEGLPPPPAGVSASAAKGKGMDNYKQGQFADAIKWLSWAVVLLEKTGDGDGTMEVLTSRASCYKEVGEYKKAVADCTKVLERDGKNTVVLVQRALLYESMEKYKLGAEDLRTVMNIDPGNRVARSTIHRMIKMAGVRFSPTGPRARTLFCKALQSSPATTAQSSTAKYIFASGSWAIKSEKATGKEEKDQSQVMMLPNQKE